MTAATAQQLTAEQIKKIALAENAVAKADAALKAAIVERDKVRDRYRVRITEQSLEKADAGKDVRIARSSRYLVRVTRFTGGNRFSLKGYLEAGHKLTAAMRQHISPGGLQERWTVKDLKGPPKPGSVEPVE